MAQRTDILVFGGTAEGRLLVEWLDARGTCNVVACTATAYGASLLPAGRNVRALQGPLSAEQKRKLVEGHDFACIVDATHPFALHITESIRRLAQKSGIDVLRILRQEAEEGDWTGVASADEAARHLATTAGNILLTTGSKDLAAFTQVIPDYPERLWARVLPVADSIGRARELGIPTDHILALQGPFSAQMNCAFIREYSIEHLVTKQSGIAGGFDEKVQAARECGIELVTILAPAQEGGLDLEEAKRELEARYGV